MMIFENDKLNIPEKYKKMSVSELRDEKERIYTKIRPQTNKTNKKMEYTKNAILFHF